jgi:uncharacterized protein (TIGR00730 family)
VTPSKNLPYSTGQAPFDKQIRTLLKDWGVEGHEQEFFEMMVSVLKLAEQKPSTADLRLFNNSLKEMRYAHKIFSKYEEFRKITIFGSARTYPTAPEFAAARDFAALMTKNNFMTITGGGGGIMAAAQEGAGREHSFGLNIRLPFEQKANATILDDPKLITFRYFFTRKLNFVRHTHAIALFPGGFGTMDEGFETLTLLQTGKTRMIPVVLIDAPGAKFWSTFERNFLRDHLLKDGWIAPWDFNLFKITDNIEEACREIVHFYHNFHSYRFVRELLVVRVQRALPDEALKQLRSEFADIILPDGRIYNSGPHEAEANEPELAGLPRLFIDFDRMSFGRFRMMIDRINEY